MLDFPALFGPAMRLTRGDAATNCHEDPKLLYPPNPKGSTLDI